jgi:hypothetical protein
MNTQDYRDYFVTAIVAAGWTAATVFLFMYPSSTNFGIWGTLVGTIGGIFHWLCVSDDKRVDAGNVVPNFDVGDIAREAMNRDWHGEENGQHS